MNYGKYTYESDFESQKDALYCGNDIFSYQMKKNVNNKTLLPLGLKKKTRKLNLFFQIIHKMEPQLHLSLE